jgi:hypothetical protein
MIRCTFSSLESPIVTRMKCKNCLVRPWSSHRFHKVQSQVVKSNSAKASQSHMWGCFFIFVTSLTSWAVYQTPVWIDDRVLSPVLSGSYLILIVIRSFGRGFLKETVYMFLSRCRLPGPISGISDRFLASWLAISFFSISLYHSTHISWTLFSSPSSFTGVWQFQTNLE